MINDPWALAVHSFSVAVKREAIIRRFDGGVAEFERVYNPPRKNGAISLILCRSLEDVDQVRSLLTASGLRPKDDFTVADMTHGPLEPHPGFKFVTDGIGWTVALNEDSTDTEGSFVPPDELMARSYHFVTDGEGRQNLVVKFDEPPVEPRMEESDEEPVTYSDNSSSPQSLESGRTTSHTIRIEYTEGSLASHDCWDVVGEVEVEVGSSALSLINSGAKLEIEPIAVRPKRGDPDLQWDSFFWRFNDPRPGNCTIIVPVENDAHDWLEGVAVWIDEEEQPAPPRYWDE